jgi:hypothetical protein
MVRGSLGPLARANPQELDTKLGEQPAHHTRWSGPLMQIDVATTAARGVAYALVTVDRDGRAYDHAISAFALVP